MGALQKIRSKSTLLVGVIAVGLLAFVIPWGEITQFVNISKDKAFVVNGDVIKTRQYSDRIEQRESLEKLKTRDGQLTEQQTSQIKEEVFQNMVTERLLDDQAERLGLAVTDAELNEMVHGINTSPVLYEIPYFMDYQTGQFSRAQLNEVLTFITKDPSTLNENDRRQQADLISMWAYVENKMRYNRLEEKYASLVAGSVLVNNVEAKAHFEDSKTVADFAYVSEDYNTIDSESIEVSDTEIQELYNIRKENFLAKYPSRTLSYFVKNVIPSEADYSEVENQIMKVKEDLAHTENPSMLVNEHSTQPYIDAYFSMNNLTPDMKKFVETSAVGDIYGPSREDKAFLMYKYVAKTVAADSVKIQTIQVQSFDPTQASIIADSLQTVLKNGKDFTELAIEMYPNMPGVGTAEWVNEITLARFNMGDLIEKAFNAGKGDVFKIDINGMTNLVRIADKTKPVNKVKLAIINIPVIVSTKTTNSIDNEINKFLSENQNAAEFEKAALNSGYNVVNDEVIYPNNPGLKDMTATREIVRWAFNESKGEIKKFETADKRIVATVTANTKEGYLPVTNKNVADLLKDEIVKDKKAKKIIEKLKSKNSSSLNSLAEALDAKVDSARFVTFETNNISGIGYEPIMNVLSKNGTPNSISEPLRGNEGVYVLQLVDKKEEAGEYDEKSIKDMIRGNYSQMLSYSATYTLLNKMDVEDNRVEFY